MWFFFSMQKTFVQMNEVYSQAQQGDAMMDKKSTYGLRHEILGRLLSIGAEGMQAGNAMSDVETLEVLLRDCLASPLPKDSSLLDSLVGTMERLAKDIQSLANKPLGEVLTDPKTDADLLVAVKDYVKKLCSSVVSPSGSPIALTIYYAAIASSLVHHNQKISQHSYESLRQSFTELSQKKWMVSELAELFSRADGICQEKKKVR